MRPLPAVLESLPELAGDGDDAKLREDPAEAGALELALGYSFTRVGLLRSALTVGSWANENQDSGWPSNACLEFFGDAVLDLVAADSIWRRFPEVAEGSLTRLRASVVSERALADAARELGLGRWLYLGRGDEQRGARTRDSTLADALEAVVGAVFLDARAGQRDPAAEAAKVFETVLATQLEALTPEKGLDAKSRLQQVVQAKRRLTPVYVQVGVAPPPENPRWRARVEVRPDDGPSETLAEGEGRSLREAERAAARRALVELAVEAERE